MRNFEASVRNFQKANYQRAVEGFRKLVSSPLREVADRARIHIRLCEQRMSRGGAAPRTAEEQYLCGIAALNGRDLDAAVEHLGKADKLAPKREHVHYALAATYSLRGNNELALKFLASAIKLRSANRTQARHDEDFQNLVAEPRFQELLLQ
jgi:tetratricopeptide (TPR) repeat protein